jgi:hypothetical protein
MKWLLFFLLSNLGYNVSGFNKNFPLGVSKMTQREKNIIKEVNGFYGLIGPNIDSKKQTTLYDLFTGDGIIQGVFFDKGNVTFVKHLVETKKVKYQKKMGKIIDNPLSMFLFSFLHRIIKIPNLMGTANTAFMYINKKMFACYERDTPYLLDIDFDKKGIITKNRQDIPDMNYFSAHSKYDEEKKIVDTIEYSMTKQTVSYYQLREDFSLLNKIEFPFAYMPLVHDFFADEKKVVMIDSPFEIDYGGFFNKKMPVRMNEYKDSYFYVYDKERKERNTYVLKEKGINLFHYAKVSENEDSICIYAPFYESLDFSNLELNGKYRCILIDKKTKKVKIEKNKALESYNLDFPINYGNNNVILRNVDLKNKKANGFVICKNLCIVDKIFFEEREILGEHQVVYIKQKPFLFFFNTYRDDYFLSLMNIENSKEIIDIYIPEKIDLGFHSIFITKTHV